MPHRRLRVLTLTDVLAQTGGAERVAAQIAVGLDPDRFERWICSTRAEREPSLAGELRRAGVAHLDLERRSRRDVLAFRRLYDLLRRERIDVLHSHKFGSNVWGVLVGRAARVPVIVAHEHTWSYEGQPIRKLLDRELIARGADVFVAVSREDERRMVEVERIPPAQIRFVPNGIPPLAPLRGTDVRAELGIARDTPVVASVSVLRPQKALDVLVRAAEQLPPETRVLIAGTGPQEEPLRSLVAELGLQERVLLIGARSDVPDVLAAADVAVQCSDFEGSPLAVLEYMAAGKAIVATRVGGVPDMIEDGVHGLLVAPRDPDGLGEALRRLLEDRQLRRRLGEAAHARQAEEFGLEAMVRRVEMLYLELWERKNAATRSS